MKYLDLYFILTCLLSSSIFSSSCHRRRHWLSSINNRLYTRTIQSRLIAKQMNTIKCHQNFHPKSVWSDGLSNTKGYNPICYPKQIDQNRKDKVTILDPLGYGYCETRLKSFLQHLNFMQSTFFLSP